MMKQRNIKRNEHVVKQRKIVTGHETQGEEEGKIIMARKTHQAKNKDRMIAKCLCGKKIPES